MCLLDLKILDIDQNLKPEINKHLLAKASQIQKYIDFQLRFIRSSMRRFSSEVCY